MTPRTKKGSEMIDISRVEDHPLYEMLGRYAMVYSTPSCFLGFVLSAYDSGGTCSVTLADAAQWTQGLMKDIIRPGAQVGEMMPERRLGLGVVLAVTAAQPAGSFGPPTWRGTGPALKGLRELQKRAYQLLAKSSKEIMDIYGLPGADGLGKEDALVKLVADTDTGRIMGLPDRVVASIVLDDARKGSW